MTEPPAFPDARQRDELVAYIDQTWRTLTRSPRSLLDALEDPKLDCRDPDGRLNLYLSAREDLAAVEEKLRALLGDRSIEKVALRRLPSEYEQISAHGLLYLPGRYVVPGGRFNEFYGWDSYFIQRGLLRGGHTELALSLTDQALYEVEHYGAVINANRTYYLTRAHPPVLAMMVRQVFAITHDHDWLARNLPLVEKFYYYWRVPPHLNQATGLSRYYDLGHGPAPEVAASETDEHGRSHYERMRDFLRHEPVDGFERDLFYDPARDELTELAYVGDRSMRESGFDPTNRFGTLNLDVIHYAPVCLNVLLYQMERDIARLYVHLGDNGLANSWNERARESARLVDTYFWDDQHGLYFDYHLGREQRRVYPFLTTLWPLWAGLASREQAARVVDQLDLFLAPGGLRTSTVATGAQWDAPFAWAPLQLFAVDGLERYGYQQLARDIARRFTAMVAASFHRTGILCEKYDADLCTARLHHQITFGYVTNEPGFGWTNAVILEFLERYA